MNPAPLVLAYGSPIMVRSGNDPAGSLREPFRYGQGVRAAPSYRPGTMTPAVESRGAMAPAYHAGRIPTRTYVDVRRAFESGGAAGTRGAPTIRDRGIVRIPQRMTPAARVIADAEAVTGRGLGYSSLFAAAFPTYREAAAKMAESQPLRKTTGSFFSWGGVSATKSAPSTIVPGLSPKTSGVVQPAGAVLPLPGTPAIVGSTTLVTGTPPPDISAAQAGSSSLAPFPTKIDPAPTTIAQLPAAAAVPTTQGSATQALDLVQAVGDPRYQGTMKAGSQDLIDGFPSPSYTPPPPPPPAEPPKPSGAKVALGVAIAVGLVYVASRMGRSRSRR